MRQSVDVTRLSRIALSNLEKEGDGSDYQAAEVQAGDIRIDNADAELDFDEQEEGEPSFYGIISVHCTAHTVHTHARGGCASQSSNF